MRLGLSKANWFKIRYKHYSIIIGISMVVPTSSREKDTRIKVRSLGVTVKSIRSVIGVLNPRKEEKETPIKRQR